MYLSKAAAGVTFLGALVVGMGAAYVVGGGGVEAVGPGSVTVTYKLAQVPAASHEDLVRAEDLEGVWRGTWDHSRSACTIVIERVEGDRFYGTLTQGEAEIAFEGMFHGKERRVFFRETKVNTLGAYSEWSLGTNSGSFSPDGRTFSGTGVDKWGPYPFTLTKQ